MRILIVLSVIILCSCSPALQKGMYHETFHQAYADNLDSWTERRFGVNLLIGDYYFKNGPRATIVWRMAEGYESTIEDYRIYYRDRYSYTDFDSYDWIDEYRTPHNCEAW